MGMLIKLSTVHIVSMRTRCFRYFRKTRRPSHNFFVAKTKKNKKQKKKKKTPDFTFYLGKLTNTKFPHMV